MPHYLQSKDNPKLKLLRSLVEQAAARKKHALTVLEGAHLLESYLACKQQPQSIFTSESGFAHPENQAALHAAHCDIFVIADSTYNSLSSLSHSTALMAVIATPSASKAWQADQDSLVLDQIQDPGNVGTLLRSAAAVGIKQVLCSTGTASLWSPRVLRAAMGAHFSLNLFEGLTYPEIINGFEIPIVATSSHRPASIYQMDLSSPLVWVLGNEGQGVSPELLEKAQAVTIPQPGGQESLNVAIAGSICLFEMSRQRLTKAL